MRDLLGLTPPPLDHFLTAWYGSADRLPSGTSGADVRLPRPLREWFEVTSRWSQPVAQQNRMLDADKAWVEHGKLVFWVENQGVRLWAVDPDEDDGEVYDRENEPGRPWEPTGVPLSVFLVHVAVFEAVMAAACGASAAWITDDQLQHVLAPVTRIPRAAWRWPCPMHRLYACDGLLAMAGPNNGPTDVPDTAEYREVFIAGRDPSRVAYLKDIAGINWDWSSWDDDT